MVLTYLRNITGVRAAEHILLVLSAMFLFLMFFLLIKHFMLVFPLVFTIFYTSLLFPLSFSCYLVHISLVTQPAFAVNLKTPLSLRGGKLEDWLFEISGANLTFKPYLHRDHGFFDGCQWLASIFRFSKSSWNPSMTVIWKCHAVSLQSSVPSVPIKRCPKLRGGLSFLLQGYVACICHVQCCTSA